MMQNSNLQTALEYIKAVQSRTSHEDFLKFYHPDIEQTEYPNTITKNVAKRNLQDLKNASAKGQQVVQNENYEVVKTHVSENSVILEIIWTAELLIPIGKLPVGGIIKAYFAQVYEFENGRIIRQRNYDCFEPFN